MRRFTGFSRPGGKLEVLQVVKHGWSWPALFFNVLWALWHRMWLLAFGAWLGETLVPVFLSFLLESLTRAGVDAFPLVLSAGLALGIGVPLAFGGLGNHWRREHLRSRGFTECGTVGARSVAAARRLLVSPAGASGSGSGNR